MKKYLISLTLLISLFIGINNTKALTSFGGYEMPDPPSFITENNYPFYMIAGAGNGKVELVYSTNSNLTIAQNKWGKYKFASGNLYYFSPVTVISSPSYSISFDDNGTWSYKAAVTPNEWNTNYLTNNKIIACINNHSCSDSTDSPWTIYYNKDILYSNGTVANSYNEMAQYLPDPTPSEITFTNTYQHSQTYEGTDYISMASININFDIFDTNNFNYQFSLDNQSNWEDLEINDYVLNLAYNTTVYVRITDNNNNIIKTATFTVTQIYDDPMIDYRIEDATELGKKLTLIFKNFNNSDNIIINNIQTGNKNEYEMRENVIFDNINIDSIYQIEVYDSDNNFILSRNIDISLEKINTSKDRYIQIAYNSVREAYLGNFFNTKSNDKCYYKFSDQEKTQISCSNSFFIEKRDINKNDYFDLLIYDKNNNLVLKKTINYQFNNNLPKFTFESTFDEEEEKQVLKIIIDNLSNNDIIYYSYDNETWNQLTNQRINTMDFYINTEVYFKIERNNEIVSRSYFNVIYKAYENSEINNEKITGLKSFFVYFSQMIYQISFAPLLYGKQVFNFLFNSKIGFYLNFILISSIFLAILRSMRR